jgi:hypothetical protein
MRRAASKRSHSQSIRPAKLKIFFHQVVVAETAIEVILGKQRAVVRWRHVIGDHRDLAGKTAS